MTVSYHVNAPLCPYVLAFRGLHEGWWGFTRDFAGTIDSLREPMLASCFGMEGRKESAIAASPMLSPGRRVPPPYGPTRGMLEGLQLLQRTSPSRVDEAYLRQHGVAPGNEYKVIGALRFLGLIDERGEPTEKCRLLRTRGPAFTLALQGIIRSAYQDLFDTLDPSGATRDQIYNYFVTRLGMGPEMATKSARFFMGLCQWAEIEVEPEAPRRRGRRPGVTTTRTSLRPRPALRERTDLAPAAAPPTFRAPFVFALTSDLGNLSEEQLAELFRKVGGALQRAFPEAS
jgi:hypothetical protein